MSIALLQSAINSFSAELEKTSDADWVKATKCDGWDVTALLRHIVGGAVSCNMALRGAKRDELSPFFHNYEFSADPRADYAAAVADHVTAFEAIADPSTVVEHPMMDMPVGQLMMFRICDFALHAWDLGAGMGREVTLDPAVVEFAWNSLSPMAPMIGNTGMFGEGPSGNVAETADLQSRLIDLTGRR
jgi:uncharacterized protein (TIGR03086 family)